MDFDQKLEAPNRVILLFVVAEGGDNDLLAPVMPVPVDHPLFVSGERKVLGKASQVPRRVAVESLVSWDIYVFIQFVDVLIGELQS